MAVLLASLGLLTGAAPMLPRASASTTDPVTTEGEFLRLTNELRTKLGLQQFRIDPELTGIARTWATRMADKGDIFHNEELAAMVSADWAKLGENVGMGGAPEIIQSLWETSPPHFRNLADPDFELIGIGVVERDGEIYVTTNFERLQPPPTPTFRAATSLRSASLPSASLQPTTAVPARLALGMMDPLHKSPSKLRRSRRR